MEPAVHVIAITVAPEAAADAMKLQAALTHLA
jgi:hypothetical protein